MLNLVVHKATAHEAVPADLRQSFLKACKKVCLAHFQCSKIQKFGTKFPKSCVHSAYFQTLPTNRRSDQLQMWHSHTTYEILALDSSLLICDAVPLGEWFHLTEFTPVDEGSGSRKTSARDWPSSKPAETNYSTLFGCVGRESVVLVYSKRRLRRRDSTNVTAKGI